MAYHGDMKRYLALPMGEAAGISAELVVKSLNSEERPSFGSVITIGDRRLFRKLSKDLRLPLPFTAYVSSDSELEAAMLKGEATIFYDMPCLDMDSYEYGQLSADTGMACYAVTAKAVSLIQNSYASLLVTPPLDARSLAMAGISTTRYETMISDLTTCQRGLTMLDAGGVKIFSHTHHMPLREALEAISFERILDTIIKVDSLTQDNKVFDQDRPLAIASVNPHHADSLSWGQEEVDAIIPAVEKARDIGIDILGPVSADHLMHRASKGLYRAVIALFHDQAHIAAMSLDFEHTVTVNWGWPFLAVRVDRGSQLEKAGMGLADPTPLIQALKVARDHIVHGVIS